MSASEWDVVEERPAGAWDVVRTAPAQRGARPAPPPRQVGLAESAARTVGSAAIPVARTAGLAASGVLEALKKGAEVADVVGRVFGLQTDLKQRVQAAQDETFRVTDERVESMRQTYEPQAGEEFNGDGQFLGAVASMPIEVAGGMGLQRGIDRSTEVLRRGGTGQEAAVAGGVSAAANVAANLVPVKVGGAAGRAFERGIQRVLPQSVMAPAAAGTAARVVGGATTGAGLGVATDVAVTGAENAALPGGEQFQDLQGEVDLSTSAGLAAALGGAAGVRRPRGLAVTAPPRVPVAEPSATQAVEGAEVDPPPASRDERMRLARKAQDYGIPLRPDMLADNRLFKFIGDTLEKVPLSGSKAEARQQAFNRAVMKQLGANERATALTPDVFDEAISRAGSEIGDISGRTSVPVEDFGDLSGVARREIPDVQQVIGRYAEDLQAMADANDGIVPGDQLRKLRTDAATQARGTSDGDLRRTLGDLVERLDDALERNAPPGDMEKLADARRRYAVAKTLEPLVAKGTEGNISPAALMGRVTADRAGKSRMARGKGGELGDLARIGQTFLKEPPSSGTAERLGAYGIVGGGAAGAAAAMTPAVLAPAVVANLAANAYNRLGPKLVRAATGRRKPAAAPPAAAAKPATAPRETPSDPRLQEIEQMKAANAGSPETLRVLEGQVKRIKREMQSGKAARSRETEADALERAAGSTFEPAVRQALLARANELRGEKIPVGEAKEIAAPAGRPATKQAVPARSATEISTTQAAKMAPTRREAELLRLRDEVTDPEVLKDLDRDIAAERKRAADTARAAEYQRLAERAQDPEVKADFEAKAKRLGGAARADEPIPTGEAVELNVETIEPRSPEGAPPMPQQRIANWRKTHKFGDLDAKTSDDVVTALGYDPAAVENAVAQLAKSPRAFEREIARIVEEGKARESETERPAGGGQGPDSPPAGLGGRVGPRPGDANPGPDDEGGGSGLRPRAPDRPSDNGGASRPDEDVGSPSQRAESHLSNRLDVSPELRGDIVDRYRKAESVKPAFDAAVRAVAEGLGDATRAVKLAPVKGIVRATSKILNDYRGDAGQIKDLVRATLVVRDIGSGADAISALRGQFGELIGLRNALSPDSEPVTTTGYRDIKANVRIDGHVCEGQVSVPEMMAAKSEGHPLYKRFEEINRVAESQGRDLTPEEWTERKDLLARQVAIYDEALRVSLDKARNAASETRVPLRSTDDSGNRRGSSSSQARQAPSGDTVTGTPSTSKNSVPLGNDSGSFIATSASILRGSPTGRQTIATSERGVEYQVRYRVADVSDLITSHDDAFKADPRFPPELQPRDRSRSASQEQIGRMAAAIKPELLAESAKISDGTPIVGSDALVESGNARTMALRQAYGAGKADHYRDWLIDNAGRFGLTADEVRGIKRPVLVRERLGNTDRAEFARQANESPLATMSETEQAFADAKNLPDLEKLDTNEDGTINLQRSADFVRQFVQGVSPADRGQLITADGRPSQRLLSRIRNAVFAHAYGDSDMVARMAEATDGNTRNVLAGLLRAAPEVARLRELSEAGARPPADFVPDVVEAARRYTQLREDGMTVAQGLAQGSLIGGEAPPRVAALMRELEVHARAPRRVADMVRHLVESVDGRGDPRQAGLNLE